MLDDKDAMPPEAQDTDPAFDRILANEQQRAQTALQSTLATSVEAKPDAYAQQRRDAAYVGLPPQVADILADVNKRNAAVERVKNDTADTPVLKQQYTDTDFAKLAHDDSSSLAGLEKSLLKAAEYVFSANPNGAGFAKDVAAFPFLLSQGVGGAARAGLETAAAAIDPLVGTILPANPLAQAADLFATASRNAGLTAKAISPSMEGIFAGGVQSGVQSAAQTFGVAGPLLLMGAPQLAVPILALVAGGNSFQKDREEGQTLATSLAHGATDAVAEWVGEKYFGLKGFLDKAIAGSSSTKLAMYELTRELPGEMGTTLWQNFNDWSLTQPDKSLADFLAEQPAALAQTAIATLVGGGLQVSAAGAINKVLENHEQIARADAGTQLLGEVFKRGAQAQLQARAPDRLESLVQSMADTHAPDLAQVRFDGRTLVGEDGTGGVLNQEQIAQLPEDTRNAIAEAISSGGEVSIPLGHLVSSFAGTPLEQELLQNARVGDNEMSQVEAQEAATAVSQLLEQTAQKAFEESKDAVAARSSHDNVKASILADLNATKRFSPEVNETYSTLVAAFYSTMAARKGVTAEELYAQRKLGVRAEGTDTDVLNEGARTKPGQISVEGYHFSPAERTVLSSSAFGSGLAGSARDDLMNAPDKRLRNRIYFYADKGTGINPEAGVGGFGHKAKLDNIYDANSDPLRLRKGGQQAFESAVLDRGFDGYLDRLDGTQSAQVIMLGDRRVPVEKLGPTARTQGAVVPSIQARESKGRDTIIDALNADKTLPSGSPTIARWQEILKGKMPEVHQALSDAGVFDGDQTRTAYKSELAVALANATETPEYNQSISTRTPVPVGGREDPHLGNGLEVGLEALLHAPKMMATVAENLAGTKVMRSTDGFTDEEKIGAFIEQSTKNLLWLYDSVPAAIRERSKLWYVGGRRIVDRWVEKYNGRYTPQQMAASLAAMSPKMAWDPNVSLSERIIDTYTNHQNTAWDDAMAAVAAPIAERNPGALGKAIAEIQGKKLGELTTDYEQAVWIRLYDESHNPRSYRLVTPEGGFTSENAKTGTGSDAVAAYGNGIDPIAKVVSVLRDGSMENISRQMGEAHKVRNFYNNIFDPYDPRSVTIDTHAVAASMLLPLGASSDEVNAALGGVGASAALGMKGTYAVHAEAYRRAAAERGVLPREMQSITWEALRGLFSPAFKTAYARNKGAFDELWRRYTQGEATLDETQQSILDFAGGITPPRWVESDPGLHAGAWDSSYKEDVLGAELPRRGAVSDAGRAGAGVSRRGQGRDDELNQAAVAPATEAKATVNIGLDIPGGGKLTVEEAVAAIRAMGIEATSQNVHQSDSEQTLVAVLSRPLTPQEGDTLSRALRQEAIPQLVGSKGEMFGPEKDKWGDFNPEYFLLPDGQRAAQPASEVVEQPARGTFNPKSLVITLKEGADLSTFLHESGHFFLTMMSEMAATEPTIAEDMNAILKWFGIKGDKEAGTTALDVWNGMSLDEQREHHEKFAESFEQYLFSGKAPSVELQPAFSKFRAWMANVYKSLKDFLTGQQRAKLNPTVAAVFDRMLATDEQIKTMEQARAYEPLFKNAAEAGMTEEEYKAHLAQGQEATERAIENMQARSLKDMGLTSRAHSRELRRIQAGMAKQRKEVEDEIKAELAATKVEQARALIKETRRATPESTEALAAWKTKRDEERARQEAAVKAELIEANPGETGIKKGQLLAKNKREMANEVERRVLAWEKENRRPQLVLPDADMEIIAAQVGYDSADAMLTDMLEQPPMRELVEGMADQRMLERYGELTTQEGMRAAADEAVHNEARSRFLVTELKALQEGTTQRAETGKTIKGKPPRAQTVNVLMSAAKQFADMVVARTKVRELRPGKHTAAETRSGKAAMKALTSGDTALAIASKRDQVLQNFLARNSTQALEEVQRGVEYLRKLAKSTTLAQDYQDQIDKLLERVELKNRTNTELNRRASLADWLEKQAELGAEPEIPDYLMDEQQLLNYRDMTVEQFRGLVDTAKAIEHIGRLKNKLLLAKEAKELEAVRQELADSITANAGNRKALNRTPASRAGRWWKSIKDFSVAHIKASSWSRILDGGKDGGPMWEYFIRPANERANFETARRAKAAEDLSNILAPWIDAGDLGGSGKFFATINRSLNREQVLAMALNTGNDGNFQRLLGGEGWTLAQVEPVLATLSREDWQAVQKVWDYLDSFRPEIGAKQKRVTGQEPEWVVPAPRTVNLADGTTIDLKGGYYPIKYDPLASGRAGEFEDADVAKRLLQGAHNAATTRRTFTKARADEVSGRPLLLTLSGLYTGVNDVIHDLAWHEWLIDTNRLLRSDTVVDKAIREHYGQGVLDQFKTWRVAIAEGDSKSHEAIDGMLGRLRRGVSAAGLGFNVMSAMMQPLGMTQSIVRVGARWVGQGIQQYIANPVAATKDVHERSEYMRGRARTQFRDLNEIRNRVDGQTKAGAAVTNGTYFLMMQVQQMVDIPTWYGAYNKAVSEGNDDSRAVALADQAVKEAQGGGETLDLSAIERGGPAQKLFTTFYSFMNTALNLGVTKAMTEKSRGKLAADLLMIYTVPAILGTLLKDALTPGDAGDEDWETLTRKLIGEQLSFLMGMMVGVREFGDAARTVIGAAEHPRDYSGPAGTRAISDTAKMAQQINQGEFDDSFRKAAINVIGSFTGLPAAQANRTITGFNALKDGETNNPLALLFGYQEP